jgi:hypothetical protein
MPASYDFAIHEQAFQYLLVLGASERSHLVRYFDSLAENPFRSGDFEEADAKGRPHQVTILGKHSIYFWVDHGECEVKIVKISDADRP